MIDELLTPDDQRLLDRLVDGELDDHERRELLLRLEQFPGGWRRCALAFLEAQVWRSESKAMVLGRPTNAPVQRAAAVRRAWNAPVWLSMVTAACLLLFFGTWLIIRDKS